MVYQDSAVTDIACAGLNGLRIGDRTLTVRRATEGPQAQAGVAAGPGGLPAGLASIPGLAINPMVAAAAATALGGGIAGATRIVVLTDAVRAFAAIRLLLGTAAKVAGQRRLGFPFALALTGV